MKKILFLIMIINIAEITFSQEIEAKFVSGIRADNHNGIVSLTWRNPSGFTDILEIYRSTNIINSEYELGKADKIAELYGSETSYHDEPPAGQNYYAVIIRNADNDVRNVILISFRNYTYRPIVIERKKQAAVVSFQADADGNHIQLYWDYAGDDINDKKVSLYRSLSPINGDFALADAAKIASSSLSDKTFTDMPVSNINYYYAIFLEDEQQHEYIPNVSITDTPAYISQNSDVMAEFHIDNFIPLPLLTFKEDPITGKAINNPFILKSPAKLACSEATEALHSQMFESYNDVAEALKKKHHIGDEKLDLKLLSDEASFAPQEYDVEYRLAVSLINEKDYLNALFTLENLLCEPLSGSLRDRVSYYAGVIYYLQGDIRKAYINLVLPLESHQKDVEPYLTSIHTMMYDITED